MNLLPLIDTDTSSVQGRWRLEDGRLASPKSGVAKILVPLSPPEEYKVTLTAEPKEGHNTLVMGLVASGNQFIALVDFDVGRDVRCSAIEKVDGLRVFDAGHDALYRGTVFQGAGPTEIVFTVRRNRVIVESKEKTIIDFKGEHSRLSMNEFWQVSPKNVLFLGTYNCEYHIHKLELTSIVAEQNAKPKSAKEVPASPTAEGASRRDSFDP